MAEYIDKKMAIYSIESSWCMHCEKSNGVLCDECEHNIDIVILDGIPAADVQFIRHGRWIDIHEYCKMNGYIPSGVAVYYWCSECMNEQEKTSDFCPCCGANMREPEAIKG